MQFIGDLHIHSHYSRATSGDLHIHSHYSRATSGDLVPEQLAFWAQKKGITLVGSGDFIHPGWVAELKEKLVEAENGLFRRRTACSG